MIFSEIKIKKPAINQDKNKINQDKKLAISYSKNIKFPHTLNKKY